MSSPKIPDKYTITSTTTLGGAIDMDLDNIHIKEIAPITLHSDMTSDSKLTTQSGLDMNIRVKELPKIDLGVTMGMKPTRISFPMNMKFGIKSMGMELFCFHVCGESMIIVEDYVPRGPELCP
jgi:hypothetical protein